LSGVVDVVVGDVPTLDETPRVACKHGSIRELSKTDDTTRVVVVRVCSATCRRRRGEGGHKGPHRTRDQPLVSHLISSHRMFLLLMLTVR